MKIKIDVFKNRLVSILFPETIEIDHFNTPLGWVLGLKIKSTGIPHPFNLRFIQTLNRVSMLDHDMFIGLHEFLATRRYISPGLSIYPDHSGLLEAKDASKPIKNYGCLIIQTEPKYYVENGQL